MARKAKVEPLVVENTETGKKITFEYNRGIIYQMDAEGFSGLNMSENFSNMPFSSAVKMIYYGMLMHQPDTTMEDAVNFFFDVVGMDEEFMSKLGELYADPYEELMNASLKNGKWRMIK